MTMNFSEEEIKCAQIFCKFYIDLLEEENSAILYYLSETATLDWFGKTIKGPRNISTFLKGEIACAKHLFVNILPVREIAYRNTHTNKKESKCSTKRKLLNHTIIIPNSPPSPLTPDEITPPKQISASPLIHHAIEAGQGDGLHNITQPLKDLDDSGISVHGMEGSTIPMMTEGCCIKSIQGSPMKRVKLNNDAKAGTEVKSADKIIEIVEGNKGVVRYVTLEGHMEFRRRSTKKFQRETKWQRPCKLHIAYSCPKVSESTIYLIIYEGNMRCRRNLLKEFEAAEDD